MGYVTGRTIKGLREKRKITQKELSEKIGVSDKTVSKWETGKGLPDIGIIEELARALGVSIAELLTGDLRENRNQSADMRKMCFTSARSAGISSRPWGMAPFHAAGSPCRKRKLKKTGTGTASVLRRWTMSIP